MRVRRSWGCGRVGAAAAPRPHRHVITNKKIKVFRVRPLAATTPPKYRSGRGIAASLADGA